MKILFVVNVDWFLISHRANLVKEAVESGWDVTVCGKDTGRSNEIILIGANFVNIDFDRSSTGILNNIKTLQQLKKLYAKLQPDLIHHISNKPILLGSIAFRITSFKSQTKVVNAISGLGILFSSRSSKILSRIIKSLLKIALNSQKIGFIFQNFDDKNLFRNMGLLNESNWILIKGSGVNQINYKRDESQNKNEKLVITFAARLLIEKGILDFISASKILFEQFKGAIFFQIIGDIDPENKNSIEKSLLLSEIIDDYLEWKGYTNDMISVYNGTDIFCLPSYYREGVPKSIIEAMSMECPIVTTNSVGCKDTVDDGVNGFLVEPKNPIQLAEKLKILIADNELRKNMGVNSRKKMLKDMTLEHVTKTTFNFYKKLINDNSRT
jgi:glycosyltransferase involved in cell wall biosynthesis